MCAAPRNDIVRQKPVGRCVAWLVALLVTAGAPGPARAGTLDQELVNAAPKVIKHLRDQGLKNVGVLKFRVQRGQAAPSDNVGLLNLSIAQRLEIALILAAEDRDERSQLGIIHDASAVAAGIPEANHLTPEGRQALFTGRYPLAWGDTKVTADAFVTGLVQIDNSLKEMTVYLVVYGAGEEKGTIVSKFTAATEAGTFIETGESFRLRGLLDLGSLTQSPEKVIDGVTKVKKDAKEEYPLLDKSAPVQLSILYDRKPVSLEIKDGRALVPEPAENQKVEFVLQRDATKARYAVALLVNGENTLFKERRTPPHCTMWVMDPGDKPLPIRGYRAGDKTVEAFRVLAVKESKQNEVRYGPDVGTICLVVFREKPAEAAPAAASAEVAAVLRGVLPAEKARDLATLKEQLRKSAQASEDGETRLRGLVVPGEETESKVPLQRVTFKPDPTPIMTATVTYYHPDKR